MFLPSCGCKDTWPAGMSDHIFHSQSLPHPPSDLLLMYTWNHRGQGWKGALGILPQAAWAPFMSHRFLSNLKPGILFSDLILVLKYHYYCSTSPNFLSKLLELQFRFQSPVLTGWGRVPMKNMKTGPVIKDYHALKERKQDCIGNLRASNFYTFVYRKVYLYSMCVYRCNIYKIYIYIWI